jgi:hypothetical protein
MLEGDGDPIYDNEGEESAAVNAGDYEGDSYAVIGDQFVINDRDRIDCETIPMEAIYAILWHSEQGFEHLEYVGDNAE